MFPGFCLKRSVIKFAVLACFFWALQEAARAHGDVHEAIGRVTAQIAEHPDDAHLFLNRGGLYRSDEDWLAALADFEKARALNPELAPLARVARAEVLLLSGKHEQARVELDTLISESPGTMYGYVVRARCLVAKNEPAKAAEDFRRALAELPRPEPSLVLECVHAEADAGMNDAALGTLDAAIAKLGPVITLVEPAIALEEKLGRFDAAIARLDAFMAPLPRKERWLAKKAAVFEKSGRIEDARVSLEQAIASIDSLPEERRRMVTIAALKDRISEQLNQLKQK